MTKDIIKGDKGFTLIELIIVVVIIGVLAAVAAPMYTRHINNAKAAEATQTISAIMTYAKSYYRAHGGMEWPGTSCDTTSNNGEWIDDIVGANNEYFDFYYTPSLNFGGTFDGKIEARGKTTPFSSVDKLIYNLDNKSWSATGRLKDIKV